MRSDALGLAALLGLSALLVTGSIVAASSLRQPWLWTGWLLFLVVLFFEALLLLRLRRAPRDPQWGSAPAPGKATFHLYATLFAVVLYLVHIDLRVPRGGFEIALTLLFSAFAGSSLVGAVLRRLPGKGPRLEWLERHWLHLHIPLVYCVLPFALLHGILAHAHGFLAHTFGVDG